jgi:predicted nucleic acid-binding protein
LTDVPKTLTFLSKRLGGATFLFDRGLKLIKQSFITSDIASDDCRSRYRCGRGRHAESERRLCRVAQNGTAQGNSRCSHHHSLMREYEAVCTCPEHAAAGLNPDEVGTFLDAIASFSQPVEVHYLWRPQLRDPADELMLEAAVNAKAAALITFNLRHFKAAVAKFNLRLAGPGEFLRGVR